MVMALSYCKPALRMTTICVRFTSQQLCSKHKSPPDLPARKEWIRLLLPLHLATAIVMIFCANSHEGLPMREQDVHEARVKMTTALLQKISEELLP